MGRKTHGTWQKVFLILAVTAGMALILVACGKCEFALNIAEDGKSATIDAENAKDGDFMTAGSLIVGEGQYLAWETNFERDGGVKIQLIPASDLGEDASAEELEGSVDASKAVLDETISGTHKGTYDVEAGDYYVSLTAVGDVTGTALITVQGSGAGQNPVMNFVGPYTCDRALITIDAKGEDEADVHVVWGASASESAEWTMSGPFRTEDNMIEYHDCVKEELVYNEDGTVKSKEEVYVGGHGFITFNEGKELTLTWQDDQEHAADDMTFVYSPLAE